MDNNEFKALIRMRLAECGYPQSSQTDGTIGRLCILCEDSKALLLEWLRNNTPVLFSPIHGIDASFLREQFKMKEPAIIIAHQMLLDDPVENSKYFRHLAITKR